MIREPALVAIDHVQLAMPAGVDAETAAEAFYAGPLGLVRVAKPPVLAARGGCWFEGPGGGVRVHLGVEEPFHPARKAHPAFVVSDLAGLVERLEGAGHPVRRADDVPGQPQWYVDDPFGSRIELVPRGDGGS